ncbi:MAG TPA: type ISP restriction/modification enzyme [Sphingomicrobium sp.]|nr:type ISP restriction/modification enzyme [Sphingomicrobium sp.]
MFNSGATGQPEDQLRAPLERLFEALAELNGKPGMVTLVGETSLAGMQTRPDYSVTIGTGKAKALVGFIEVKAPGKGADPRKFKDQHDKEQWAKLKALPNILYTDGNGFSLWQDGELVSLVQLDGDIESDGAKLAAPPALLPLIESFLGWNPIPPRNAHALAVTAARLCRFLRDEVVEQMAPEDSALRDLAKDWRGLLFPEANDAQFADGYAQAVTFGLLMARSEKIELADGLAKVAGELAESNTLIGRAFRLLTEQEKLLGPSLDTLVRVLDAVQWGVIAKGNPEAWIDFYELFLSVYDNRLRKLTGSYYTPPEVVRAMVRLCDEALRTRFDKPAGLADPEVQITDPAVGSGTFLLGLLRHMADWKELDEGKGAVGPFITEAAKRLFGFELQFGPFAVAQLRLHAEMIEFARRSLPEGAEVDLSTIVTPHFYVTDTLGDPNQAFERGTGIYAALSKSQEEANEVKRTQPITVVIGNPPYKEKAKGKGSWIEQGSGNSPAPLNDWQPPKKWGVGAHAKHLRNLYIYFWRWAAWKVFESGHGKKEPSGIVCYITVAGFLNGPGFQKMREQLRRECDEIWVIDCSPEGHQPEVATRIFQGVQHPVCITIASRSPSNDPEKPARVHYRSLAKGRREAKFEELKSVSLASKGWVDGASDWRAPFLPELTGGWADFVPLDSVLGDCGSGVMPGRTWIIAPDAQALEKRWKRLLDEKVSEEQAKLFHPHEGGDRTISKATDGLPGKGRLASIEFGLQNRDSVDPEKKVAALDALKLQKSEGYGFRSFDRQWIIPDKRLINRPNPNLWENYGPKQVYLTAQMDRAPSNGPAATLCSIVPDLHHYAGRGGRVFALWEDAAAKGDNIAYAAMKALTKQHGAAPKSEDVFAYVAALLVNPAYTEKFNADLVRPGLRVPLTADKKLFAKGAEIGREVIWLHTFGERFNEGREPGVPKLPQAERPFIPAEGTIPSTPEGFPDTIDYDAAKERLKIGTGYIENVPPAAWAYQVSGKPVLKQWFSYRKKDREKPQIGDRRPPSPLGEIQPDHWLPEYTSELLNVINVLGLLVKLEPRQALLLDEIVDGPLIPASKVKTTVAESI